MALVLSPWMLSAPTIITRCKHAVNCATGIAQDGGQGKWGRDMCDPKHVLIGVFDHRNRATAAPCMCAHVGARSGKPLAVSSACCWSALFGWRRRDERFEVLKSQSRGFRDDAGMQHSGLARAISRGAEGVVVSSHVRVLSSSPPRPTQGGMVVAVRGHPGTRLEPGQNPGCPDTPGRLGAVQSAFPRAETNARVLW